MSQLIINNHLIDEPIENILYQVRKEIKGRKLKDIEVNGDDIKVTCPFHSNGQEKEPDCHIKNDDTGKLQYGTFHCFACDESGNLCKFIGGCFDRDEEFGKQWLLDHYGNIFVERKFILQPITLKKEKEKILDESILDTMQEYHPYMLKRKLDLNICKQFKVKYDPKSECLVFPIYDEHGCFIGITRRSVKNKTFHIENGIDKRHTLYLLNHIIRNNIKKCALVEGQIDALTCYGFGFPAIATLGGICKEQINLLNNSGVRVLYTIFDNDEAGKKFTNFLNKYINEDILVINVVLPEGYKDVNDLDKDLFLKSVKEAEERFI